MFLIRSFILGQWLGYRKTISQCKSFLSRLGPDGVEMLVSECLGPVCLQTVSRDLLYWTQEQILFCFVIYSYDNIPKCLRKVRLRDKLVWGQNLESTHSQVTARAVVELAGDERESSAIMHTLFASQHLLATHLFHSPLRLTCQLPLLTHNFCSLFSLQGL